MMLMILGYPDPGQAIPIGGTTFLLIYMLRMVWKTRDDWVVEKKQMKSDWATAKLEWAATKAELIAENKKALTQMQENCVLTTDALRRVHIDELASLKRRIQALETEAEGNRK